MNKKIIIIILIFLHVIFYPFFSDVALATVGGAQLLSDFGYSEKDGTVYFIFSNQDAMGGQRIERYDPITKKREVVFDNTQLKLFRLSEVEFAELAKKYNCPTGDYSCVMTKRSEEYEIQKERIWNNLSGLPRIDLLKNDIKIEAFIERREEESLLGWRNVTFQVVVGQGSKKEIGKFELNGCERIGDYRTRNFEINFDGFLIPNSNSILFLAHTEGLCHEMGYGLDEIFLINGFEILDSRSLGSINEARDAIQPFLSPERQGVVPCFYQYTCPTQGGIFLSFSNDIPITDEKPLIQAVIQPETIEEYREPEEQQEKPKILTLILGSAVSILSLFLIYLYFKKRGKPKS